MIENTARQNIQNTHHQTRIVSNPLKAINPAKDVVVAPGGESIDGTEIALNDSFDYRLDSSVIPGNRAYAAGTPWSITDTFNRVYDQYTGSWAIYASRDVHDGDQLVFADGDLLQTHTGPVDDAYGELFAVSFDEASYTFRAEATQAFVDLVNTRPDLEAAFSVYTQMVRIAPAERVENTFTEHYNGVDRESNIVWTKTPEHPGIDVEKFTLDEGLDAGDRDTSDVAYLIPDGERKVGTPVGIRVTNTGDVPLRNVTLTDHTHDGLAGTVTDIVCHRGATTVAPDSIGDLAVGEQIDCRGVLTGMKDGQSHADTATVEGDSVRTGNTVTDSDPWYATTPGVLAATGAEHAARAWVLGGAGVLLLAGIGLYVAGVIRRRRATSTTGD